MAPTKNLPEVEEDGPETESPQGGRLAVANNLTNRQAFFVRLVLDGKSHSEAFRTAYCKPDITAKLAADGAYKVSQRDAVRQALKAAHFDQPYHRLLTKEDLLKGYAGIFMSERATATERCRAGREYAILAGYMPKEWDSMPTGGGDPEAGKTTIVVNVFQNAPSRVRAEVPVTPVHELTAHKGNGNGNGNGHR